MGRFGHRVIGAAAAAAEAADIASGKVAFGPRVVGGSATPSAAARPRGATDPGVKIVGAPDAATPTEGISVAQIEQLLTDNHTLLDSLFEAELSRPSGARSEALVVFKRFELAQGGRSDIIKDIDDLLAARGTGAAPTPEPETPKVSPRSAAARKRAAEAKAAAEAAEKEAADAAAAAAQTEATEA